LRIPLRRWSVVLTVAAYALKMGISKSRVYFLIHAKRLDHEKLGGTYLIPASATVHAPTSKPGRPRKVGA
jgi:excisionase family DNA binding protein